jgi:hypothetical protein
MKNIPSVEIKVAHGRTIVLKPLNLLEPEVISLATSIEPDQPAQSSMTSSIQLVVSH